MSANDESPLRKQLFDGIDAVLLSAFNGSLGRDEAVDALSVLATHTAALIWGAYDRGDHMAVAIDVANLIAARIEAMHALADAQPAAGRAH